MDNRSCFSLSVLNKHLLFGLRFVIHDTLLYTCVRMEWNIKSGLFDTIFIKTTININICIIVYFIEIGIASYGNINLTIFLKS